MMPNNRIAHMINNQKNKTMLITGVSGLLGSNLAYYFRKKYDLVGIFNHHPVKVDGVQMMNADVTNIVMVKSLLNDIKPDIIIHCAALSRPDECEVDRQLAQRSNVLATKNIMETIKDMPIKLIYTSTDAIFDGKKGNYQENDKPNPPHFYGRTKYQAELEVLRNKQAIIARINIFGWNVQDKHSLAEWVIHELSSKRPIMGFTDAFFSSIYTFKLAELFDVALNKNIAGIYHFCSRDSMSKYQFAQRLAELFGLDKDFKIT